MTPQPGHSSYWSVGATGWSTGPGLGLIVIVDGMEADPLPLLPE